MARPIRIAISGGGMAGASLLHALLKYPHLDVHIFESAAEFREAGAAVGVARNGLAALNLIGASAGQCLERAGAVSQRGVRFLLAQGEGRNKLIDEARDDSGKALVSIVHRAALLRELLDGVPPERLHVSKKLDRVERAGDDGPVMLHFTDGTTHECDILVGADGIHSTVRRIVLGEGDPAAYPRNAGWWAVMALKPYADARASLGEGPVDIDDAREHMWVGDGTYLMHNILNRGQLVQVIMSAYEKGAEASDKWHRMVSAEEITKLYQDWPLHLKKAVNELLCDQPEQPAIYLWDHPPARTYVAGPICIMGDAAHATTPWQGSGCGMSFEDSLILSTLLGRSTTPAESLVALQIYDQVRRPRTQRIVESSRGTGLMLVGKWEVTGLDLEKLRQDLLPRWDFIIDFDNGKARDEAVEMMVAELAK
ncbi:salicylate hydroxylase [Histoplasma capsulatum var. duboisii H88]|uniref:Salicylate hydroxylase n=1 Tax=Ajellomyces capsulatus (strain H88) TaxID=544711 RepID=F0US77_AJEC8|nr:salicylate hydroxylase [Histoplasma capsulatum var. duboisii H88]QSS54351.1 salicylate hydroxylase [Histoplasma capsulatum var. duboisii H88]